MPMAIAETMDIIETWLRVRGSDTITNNKRSVRSLERSMPLTANYSGNRLECDGAGCAVTKGVEYWRCCQRNEQNGRYILTFSPGEDMKTNYE